MSRNVLLQFSDWRAGDGLRAAEMANTRDWMKIAGPARGKIKSAAVVVQVLLMMMMVIRIRLPDRWNLSDYCISESLSST